MDSTTKKVVAGLSGIGIASATALGLLILSAGVVFASLFIVGPFVEDAWSGVDTALSVLNIAFLPFLIVSGILGGFFGVKWRDMMNDWVLYGGNILVLFVVFYVIIA